MKLVFAFPLCTLMLPRGAMGLPACAFTECSEQSNCDDLSVGGTPLQCFCEAEDLPVRRELGQTGSRQNKTKKKSANRGSVRALGPKKLPKKCGKRDGEPITGLCGPCPDAKIACTECTEPGEKCCDFNGCPGSQRTCQCNDLGETLPCSACNLAPLYLDAGRTCCSDEALDILECPSCSDQHALDCAKCSFFQDQEGVDCCDLGSLQACGPAPQRKRFRFLKDATEFHAKPDQPHMIEHFLTDTESDPNAHFSQTQGILPPEDLSKAVAFVEEHFRGRESITENDRKEYKLVATAEIIIDLFGPQHVRRILDLLYDHVGTEDQPVTGIMFQRFEHDGTSVSPYHTDGKAISLVILLNDDYDGGEMTYLTGDGPTVIESVAGSATVHGPGVVHGNAAVNGIKYQLTFSTFPNAQSECVFAGLLHVK